MEYEIINKISELPAFDKGLPIFSDIETDGLYGPLRMIQFYQPQTSQTIFIVDIAPTGYDKMEYQHELLSIEDFIMSHHTVWYNSSYDLGTLNISPDMGIKHPDEVTKDTKYVKKVDDLFYAMRTGYAEFMEFGLKKVVTKLRYTKDMYKGINTDDNPKGFIRGAYVSKNAFKYAALDVLALSLIWEDKKIQNVIENNMAYKVDMMSQAYALIYQQNGLILDRGMWEEKLEYAMQEVVTYTALLPRGFNPNSFKQVRAYLDTDKSDHEALVAYATSGKPKAIDAEHIIKLKKYKKQVTYLKSIEFDRMFTKFNAAGAITGRFTSKGGDLHDHFNAQQIPRDFQKLFTQDVGDTTCIGLDYATLELRLACSIFGSKEMYQQLKDGRDLHTEMGCLASHKDIPPKGFDEMPLDGEKGLIDWNHTHPKYLSIQERGEAKSINFGYVFGMSAKAYIPYAYTNYGIKVTMAESVAMRNQYFSMYPEFSALHSHIWNNYKKPNFFVYTPLGRKVKPKLGTDGINTPVQGGGAETTKLAAHYMIKEDPMSLRYIFNVVHDCIYTRVPTHSKDYWFEMQERNMLKGWTEISKCSIMKFKDIPMMAE